MREMTRPQWREFASSGTRTGKAAVTRADGTPHVTPIWFVLDGDDLVFTTGEGSVKHRSLVRDPRICVCVDDQQPPYSYVMITGEARLSGDLTEMRKWATALGGRYMGADRAEEFGARNAVPGELLVRVRITRVIAHSEMASLPDSAYRNGPTGTGLAGGGHRRPAAGGDRGGPARPAAPGPAGTAPLVLVGQQFLAGRQEQLREQGVHAAARGRPGSRCGAHRTVPSVGLANETAPERETNRRRYR